MLAKPKRPKSKLLMSDWKPWRGPNFPKLRQSGELGAIASDGIQLESRPRACSGGVSPVHRWLGIGPAIRVSKFN